MSRWSKQKKVVRSPELGHDSDGKESYESLKEIMKKGKLKGPTINVETQKDSSVQLATEIVKTLKVIKVQLAKATFQALKEASLSTHQSIGLYFERFD